MRRALTFFICLTTALVLGGCSSVVDPSDNVTQDFNGVLEQSTEFIADIYEFDVAQNNGEYSITLLDVGPDPNQILTVYLGGVNASGFCVNFQNAIANAIRGRQALNGPINKGHYCLGVAAAGNSLKSDTTYSVRLSHP
jgi:hypothetical protein